MEFKGIIRSTDYFQVFRIYYDRLIDDKDRDWFTGNVKEVLKTDLKADFDQLFLYLDRNQDGRIDDHELHALMFCDFVDVKSEPRPYLEVTEPDKVRKTVEGFLDEFNNMSKKPMNLVLFRYGCLFFF